MKTPRIALIESLRDMETVVALDEGGELPLTVLSLLIADPRRDFRVIRSAGELAACGVNADAGILLGALTLCGAPDRIAQAMRAAGGGRRLVIAPCSDGIIRHLKAFAAVFERIVVVDNMKCGNRYSGFDVISWADYDKTAEDGDFLFIPTRDRILADHFRAAVGHRRVVDVSALENADLARRVAAVRELGYHRVFDARFLESVQGTLATHSDMSRTARFAFQHLQPADCTFDIGAHRGQLSALFKMRCAAVDAFEPEPDPYADMVENFGLLPDVHVHNLAVSDRSGVLDFYLDDRGEFGGGSSLFSNMNSSGRSIRVEVVSLHDAIRLTGRQPAFIKIDVEGAEPEVVLGGADYIKEKKPSIVFEMYQPIVESRRERFQELIEFLNEFYDLHCLETGGDPRGYTEPGGMPPMTNVAAVPRKEGLPRPWGKIKV